MARARATTLMYDSWAFIEEFFDGPRRRELEAARRLAHRIVTTHLVLVETHGFLVRRTTPAVARAWWQAIRKTDLVVVAPTLDEVDVVWDEIPAHLGMSAVDVSLVHAARSERTEAVATGDRAFSAVGLHPLFSGP